MKILNKKRHKSIKAYILNIYLKNNQLQYNISGFIFQLTTTSDVDSIIYEYIYIYI